MVTFTLPGDPGLPPGCSQRDIDGYDVRPDDEPDMDEQIESWRDYLATCGDDLGSDIADLPDDATDRQKAAIIDRILKDLRRFR